jgi:xanthine dehydrogenase YagR molybdenum-binding subunit
MPEYTWPPLNKRKVMGQRLNRLDGMQKASGRAKYTTDLNPQGLLFSAILTCPHPHAVVKSIDLGPAQAMKGVTGVRAVAKPGQEIQWAGDEIAYVAATSEAIARDAIRAIKVEYDVKEHFVREDRIAKAGSRARPAGEQVSGDPDKALKEAAVTVSGDYGIPVITHCCLEPHGNVVQWNGEKVDFWPSTQNVSGIGGDLARGLSIPAANIHVQMDHVGGGFGSKFPSDRWGVESAQLSKMSGGKPVRVYLDRASELTIAGVRPSHFGKITIGASKDGTITAWQSETWSTGGFGGGGMAPMPYVFTNIPNKRLNHTAVSINAGGARAWRAPNHPQASFLTCAAIEDLAAKLEMDPVEVYKKNVKWTPREAVYLRQIDKAAGMIGWKQNWRPRGKNKVKGSWYRGLGVGIATWGGLGHASRCLVRVKPDGTIEALIGTQDLGTGTRTAITQVVAETMGVGMNMVTVKIGDNAYPASGASGGSTTIGGVSASSRKASIDVLDKLYDLVAPKLGVPKDQLEAVDQRIQVKGNAAKAMPWREACQLLGPDGLSAENANNPKDPGGLISQGVGGIQMADVMVDLETGVVKMNKLVAVQDCGLIVNPKTAESQVYGACIMSICAALMEERIMDETTGRVLNADMEFYKLAGAKDIGEIQVEMEIDAENDKRGVIGLGEPCAVAGIAAIANAVANACGVRVPMVPTTPDRVLAALYGSKMERMA